jgi:hypothetical protein
MFGSYQLTEDIVGWYNCVYAHRIYCVLIVSWRTNCASLAKRTGLDSDLSSQSVISPASFPILIKYYPSCTCNFHFNPIGVARLNHTTNRSQNAAGQKLVSRWTGKGPMYSNLAKLLRYKPLYTLCLPLIALPSRSRTTLGIA